MFYFSSFKGLSTDKVQFLLDGQSSFIIRLIFLKGLLWVAVLYTENFRLPWQLSNRLHFPSAAGAQGAWGDTPGGGCG